MNPSTPACSTLHHALEEFRKPRGIPPKTWLCIMKQQLKSELNMNWNEVLDAAKGENIWKTLIEDYSVQQMLPRRRVELQYLLVT